MHVCDLGAQVLAQNRVVQQEHQVQQVKQIQDQLRRAESECFVQEQAALAK